MGLSYHNAEVPLDQIDVSWRKADGTTFTRYRDASKDKEGVAKLASSIRETGDHLAQPIVCVHVDGRYRLVAGGYRLAAFKLLDKSAIPARVARLDGPWDDDLVRLVEIDENLVRTELSPALRDKLTVERVKIVARRKKAEGFSSKLEPNSRKRGRQVETGLGVAAKEVAALTGRSETDVHRSLKRGSKIAPDVLDAVEGTPLDKGVNLDKLATLDEADQKEIAKQLTDYKRGQIKLGSNYHNTVEVKADGTTVGTGIGAKGTKSNIPRQPQATITKAEAARAKEAAAQAEKAKALQAQLDEAAAKVKAKEKADKPKAATLATSKMALDNLRKVPADIKRFFGGVHPDHKEEALAILKRISGVVKLLGMGDTDAGAEESSM